LLYQLSYGRGTSDNTSQNASEKNGRQEPSNVEENDAGWYSTNNATRAALHPAPRGTRSAAPATLPRATHPLTLDQ
jgi:hypothetical protein